MPGNLAPVTVTAYLACCLYRLSRIKHIAQHALRSNCPEICAITSLGMASRDGLSLRRPLFFLSVTRGPPPICRLRSESCSAEEGSQDYLTSAALTATGETTMVGAAFAPDMKKPTRRGGSGLLRVHWGDRDGRGSFPSPRDSSIVA
jgi:hypothetical protein